MGFLFSEKNLKNFFIDFHALCVFRFSEILPEKFAFCVWYNTHIIEAYFEVSTQKFRLVSEKKYHVYEFVHERVTYHSCIQYNQSSTLSIRTNLQLVERQNRF